jgi:hypothetical protein
MHSLEPGILSPDAGIIQADTLRRQHDRYLGAQPFPHLVIDNLFSDTLLHQVAHSFDSEVCEWREYHGPLQRKRATAPASTLPRPVQVYFDFIGSGPFLRYLTGVTGIEDLIPDPALFGGGMHQADPGGGFAVHCDFAQHPRTRLTNRLAVITYLNEGWSEQDGGALELWHAAPPRSAQAVLPVFGRTIIMERSARALHGHPQPVREGRHRRAVIAYFYTNDRATALPHDRLATTYFGRAGYTPRQRAEVLARLLMPPIMLSGLQRLRGQWLRRRPMATR